MRGVREAQPEWKGAEVAETPQNHAKTMRNPSENQANTMLQVRCFHGVNRLCSGWWCRCWRSGAACLLPFPARASNRTSGRSW